MLKHRVIASLFILIVMGCNTDSSIDYDELIAIMYVKGEELPYTGSSIEKYENGQKSYEVTYKDGELISEKCWDEDGNKRDCN